MRRYNTFIILSLLLLICSCSTIRLKSRKGKDIHLDVSSIDKINGDYKNSNSDSLYFQSTLYNNFNDNTIYRKNELQINIEALDKHHIKLRVFDNETIIDSLTIKGKYRRGYFKIKRQWNSSFIFGPLIWELGDNFKYLGVTKENKLVIIDSGNGGVMLLVAFPIMGAGGGQVEHEYERIK
jgi:hypothetical protein